MEPGTASQAPSNSDGAADAGSLLERLNPGPGTQTSRGSAGGPARIPHTVNAFLNKGQATPVSKRRRQREQK